MVRVDRGGHFRSASLPPVALKLWATMQRIAVIGCGGAGKTTVAPALGRRLGLPVVHLDEHYWSPGCQPADPAAWRALHERLVAGESWVIDGNHMSTLEGRLAAADTVVFLDVTRWCYAWRVTWRVLAGRGHANTAPGCSERLDRRHLHFLAYTFGAFPASRGRGCSRNLTRRKRPRRSSDSPPRRR